ncbi:hypothetical protein, partial [Ruegeria sp. HKCCSP335]|uniref:hypothetical protein n=1 Tax=Ruegeria sp. HKCCSP335 TaxID=2794833 RepID=UPI001AE3F989
MYFFQEPDDVFKIVGGNLASYILGGKSVNEAAFRAAQRARAKNTPIATMVKSKGGRDFADALFDRIQQLNISDAEREYFEQAPPDEKETDWARLMLGFRLKRSAPQTVDFINKIARGSIVCRNLWKANRRVEAIEMVARLPWAHVDTMQWYLSALRTNEGDLPTHWHLPAQTLGLLAVLQMRVIEGAEDEAPGEPTWSLGDLVASRHPETGHLAAIRYFFDWAKAAAGVETNVGFYEKAFKLDQTSDSGRFREAKRFRAGTSVPSHRICLQVQENLMFSMDERSAGALLILANTASFCQRVFERLRKTDDLTLNPISLFDDFREIRAMP